MTAASAVLFVATFACCRLEARAQPHHRGRALQSCALQTQMTYGSREWVWVWVWVWVRGLESIMVHCRGFVSNAEDLFWGLLGARKYGAAPLKERGGQVCAKVCSDVIT